MSSLWETADATSPETPLQAVPAICPPTSLPVALSWTREQTEVGPSALTVSTTSKPALRARSKVSPAPSRQRPNSSAEKVAVALRVAFRPAAFAPATLPEAEADGPRRTELSTSAVAISAQLPAANTPGSLARIDSFTDTPPSWPDLCGPGG